MSPKYALIFVLGVVCCLVATEAAAQRRSGVARASNSETEAIKPSGEVQEQQLLDGEKKKLDQELNAGQLEVRENSNAVANNQKQQKKSAVRSSDEDARARRTVRSRSGARRNGNRAGGRRRGGRGRRGNRRSGPIRRRVGRLGRRSRI